MALHLTPKLLELCYELLRATPPFKRWKLPHADEVEFHVIKSSKIAADADHIKCSDGSLKHKLRVDVGCNTLQELQITVAHEMCHIRQRRLKLRSAAHGVLWHRLADQVCRVHRFDRATF